MDTFSRLENTNSSVTTKVKWQNNLKYNQLHDVQINDITNTIIKVKMLVPQTITLFFVKLLTSKLFSFTLCVYKSCHFT